MTITCAVLYFRGPLIIGQLPYDLLGKSVYDYYIYCALF